MEGYVSISIWGHDLAGGAVMMHLQIAGIASGGPAYNPGMMAFDGDSGFYSIAPTSSGNKVTVVFRFSRASFTGDTLEYFFKLGVGGNERCTCIVWSSDNSDSDKANRMMFFVENDSNVRICELYTPVGFLDGDIHTGMFSFDGDAGTAQLIIDGSDEDDTGNADRVAPTTGTLDTGASLFSVGAITSPANFFGGTVGFWGHREAYLTNWNDFMDSSGNPKEIDESGWTEWGAQPMFWNQFGTMDDNKGSAGNMTKTETITGPA